MLFFNLIKPFAENGCRIEIEKERNAKEFTWRVFKGRHLIFSGTFKLFKKFRRKIVSGEDRLTA